MKIALKIALALLLTSCAQLDRDERVVARTDVIVSRMDRAVVLANIDRLEWQLRHNFNRVDRVLIRDELDRAYRQLRELEP